MWFVYYYIISTVVCFAIIRILSASIKQRAKRDGYRSKHKSTFAEKLSAALPMFVPFINVIIILIAIFSQDKLYEGTIKKMVKAEANKGE